MKIQTFAVMTVAVAAMAFSPSAYAAECTPEELATAENNENSEFEQACPALFKDDNEVLDLSNLEAFDAATLEQITPCKEATCTAFLGKLYEKAPNCEASGLNIKNTYKGLQDVCTKIAAGGAKVEDVTTILKGLVSNVTFEEVAAGSDSEETGSAGGVAATIKPLPVAKAEPAPTEATTTAPKDAAQATTPAPSTKQSSAVSVTGIVGAVVSTAFATALLM